MIAVFAAMDAEVRACLGGLSGIREATVAGFSVLEGDVAVVCRTGLGRRADEAAEAVLTSVSPNAVLSVGTAGGLSRDLRAGEIALCERVHLWREHEQAVRGQVVGADGGLLAAAREAAQECGIRAHTGRSVTVDSVAWGPEEKAQLREWMGHDIVEMESFWIGRAAAERGIPFLAIRVVSDQAADRVPEIPGLVNEDGSVDYSRLLPYVWEHPELTPLLAEQAERSRRAIESLSTFLRTFIPAASHLVSGQA